MQIVIDIPEEIYNSACVTNNIWDMRMAGFICSAIANGTPLPKRHGKLIDIDDVYESIEGWREDRGWIVNTIDLQAPTIIEADRGESEGEE